MKKTVYILNMILTAIVGLVAILILVSAGLARLQNQTPRIFGYTFHIVVSPSMEPDIKVGDFVLAKEADINDVKEGDYVIFTSPDPTLRGAVIIHKAVEIIEGEGGKRELITSGIKEGSTPDRYPVREIIGIYHKKSTTIGKITLFFTNTRNLLFMGVILISGIFIAKNSVSIISHIKNKNKN